MITISKHNIFGEVSTMQLNTTREKFDNWTNHGHKTHHVQDYFPELNADEREFILTGISSVQWDEMFGDVTDEDDHTKESAF